MRTFIIFLLAGLLPILGTCQNKKNLSEVKAAIKTLNEKETQAYENYDFEAEAAVWLHKPYVVHAGFTDTIRKGWNHIRKVYKYQFENLQKDPDSYIDIEIIDPEVHILGNTAVLKYREKLDANFSDGSHFHEKTVHKYFVKQNGQWKLLAIF